MKINFQAKVILGSIIGFISTCITLFIIFFPNFFNLEQKKIKEFNHVLTTENDFKDLVTFLIKNQGKVVRINIKYFEEERFTYRKKHPSERDILSTETDTTYEGHDLIGEIDPNGHIIVCSDYKYFGPYMMSLHRYRGGFGIWIKEDKDNKIIDKNYLIIISSDSDKNRLYKWNIGDSREEMILDGIFFVEKIFSISEYDNITSAKMSYEWLDKACKDGECFGGSFVIDLNPLNKKEIEMLKY